MESFCTEILSLITESFDDDLDLTSKILWYLFDTTTDTEMKKEIELWFDRNNYCINCGCKKLSYQYETHDNEESYYTTVNLCPICDCTDVEEIKCKII